MRFLFEKGLHVPKLLLLYLTIYIAVKIWFTPSSLTTNFLIKLTKLRYARQESLFKLQHLPRPKIPIKPIFIIKTFYYPSSKSFMGSDAVVALFNSERHHFHTFTFLCNRSLESGLIETSIGTVIDLDVSPPQCKLGVFRLTCLFVPRNDTISKFDVGVATETGDIEYGELSVSPPNKKKYGFVSCMSRMVAGDDWAMIIFAMEVFRLFGGDLAVAPVECVITQVMDLLRLYEKDGILKVQPGFKPRALKGLGYDPTKETEYANQMSTSHECFYEYKDTAEFISFPDWDDMLFVHHKNGRFMTYFETFSPFFEIQPNAAAFSINRINIMLESVRQNNHFSLSKFVQKTEYGSNYIDPKMVIRPHLIAGNWIHESKKKEDPKYYETKVDDIVSTFVHLHYSIINRNETTTPIFLRSYENASDYVDPKILDASFKNMLIRHSFKFNHKDYPEERLYNGLIGDCYHKIGVDMISNNTPYCPTLTVCHYSPQKIKVWKIESNYMKPFITGSFEWHEKRNTEFVESDNGCL